MFWYIAGLAWFGRLAIHRWLVPARKYDDSDYWRWFRGGNGKIAACCLLDFCNFLVQLLISLPNKVG